LGEGCKLAPQLETPQFPGDFFSHIRAGNQTGWEMIENKPAQKGSARAKWRSSTSAGGGVRESVLDTADIVRDAC